MTIIKGHWQLLVLVALVFALWPTSAITPLKLLIVFLHELSHAAMTVLTGGEVISLSVSANQGGEVWSRGGSRFLILTAGYLGSLAIGLALLFAAVRTQADRAVMAAFGALMLLVAALYVRDAFALAFTVGTGLAMIAMARFLPRDLNDLALRIIGLTSMVYVPYDIFSDTIARPGLPSDAHMLAEEFGGATVIWGGLWLALSIVAIIAALRYGLGPASNLTWPRKH